MSYCLNPRCRKPHNPSDAKFCITCGSRLLLGDRYRALKPLSQGGIGRTFLAVDERETTQPNCIIKQFSPHNQGTKDPTKATELFRQEVMRLQALGQHPQIPELLAYFTPETQGKAAIASALVQRLIAGESLAQELEAEGAFNESEIRELLAELLPILQFIHDNQVIHRDINPNNIIRRSRDGQLVLVDFGAAKFTSKTALARTGTVVGSAAYTAPEQLRGKAVPSSDLYSLGVTCIHLLTHIHPFDLFSNLEGTWVWQDYLTQPVSTQMRRMLDKMLAGTAKRRYQSAAEILADLDAKNTSLTRPKTLYQTNVAPPSIPPEVLIPRWKCIGTFKGHLSSVNAIAFSPDGHTIASGSADKTVKVWDLESVGALFTFSGHLSLVDAVAFSPNGRLLASGSWDREIKLWHLQKGELSCSLCDHSGWIQSLAFSPDGQVLVSGSADKTIKIWNLRSGQLQTTLSEHLGAVRTLAISPDGQILASGSADRTIKIWDLASGEMKLTLEGHLDAVDSLAFSPSGYILASGSADKTIKIWDLENNQLLWTLEGHGDIVQSVALDARGSMLLSGSRDRTLKIWHPGRGELLSTLTGHTSGITSVAISPDSFTLASGSQDKTIKIWRFQ